jgi:hypothetical protein
MMMSGRRYFLGVLLAASVLRVVAGVDLSFIDEKFDAFLVRIVPEADRSLFSNYYGKISALLNAGDAEITHDELFKRALAHLKKEHKDWFSVINTCIKEKVKKKDDPILQKVQTFLTRYGVYRDFLDARKSVGKIKKLQLPDFVDEKFVDFVNRVVPQDERDIFSLYYARLSSETAKGDSSQIKATHSYLFAKALDSLKVDRPEWFKQMAQFLSNMDITGDQKLDEKIEKAQLFLRRYGAYQEFLEIKDVDIAQEEKKSEGGILAQIGSFFSNMGQTIAGWFGFGVTKTA